MSPKLYRTHRAPFSFWERTRERFLLSSLTLDKTGRLRKFILDDLSLPISESITEVFLKVFLAFVDLIFTSSESELYYEELPSSDTLIYMSLGQSKVSA